MVDVAVVGKAGSPPGEPGNTLSSGPPHSPKLLHHRVADGIKDNVWRSKVIEQHDKETVVGQLVEIGPSGFLATKGHSQVVTQLHHHHHHSPPTWSWRRTVAMVTNTLLSKLTLIT